LKSLRGSVQAGGEGLSLEVTVRFPQHHPASSHEMVTE
jgi:hypothetical protein